MDSERMQGKMILDFQGNIKEVIILSEAHQIFTCLCLEFVVERQTS